MDKETYEALKKLMDVFYTLNGSRERRAIAKEIFLVESWLDEVAKKYTND